MSGNNSGNNNKSKLKKASSIAKTAGAATSAVGVLLKTADLINEWRKGKNHPEWYTKYGDSNLVALSLGQPERLGYNEQGELITTDAQLIFEMTIPQDKADSCAILAQAAAAILTQIRTTANVNANYTVNDVVKAILNLREITAGVAIMMRTFEGSRYIDPYDGETPIKMPALSFFVQTDPFGRSPSEGKLLENISNIEARINPLLDSIRMLIPMNMALFERTYWLFSNYFADSPTTKHSLLVPTLTNLKEWTYNTTDETKLGDFTFTSTKFASTTELFDWLNSMIAKFVADPIQSKLAGDLMKAYGTQAFPLIPRYSREEKAHIVYDEDVLNQIQSAKTLQFTSSDYRLRQTAFNVTKGTIRQEFTLPSGSQTSDYNLNYLLKKPRVNTFRDTLEAGRALALTRLAWYTDKIRTDAGKYIVLTSVGTEVLKNVAFASAVASDANGRYVKLLHAKPPQVVIDTVGSDRGSAIRKTNAALLPACWSIVDWMPAYHLGPDVEVTNGTDKTSEQIMQEAMAKFVASDNDIQLYDIQNWAIVDAADLSAYHALAGKSLLWISSIISKPNTFMYL